MRGNQIYILIYSPVPGVVETNELTIRSLFLLNSDYLNVKMDSMVDQVKKLAATADEAGRKKLLDSLRDLSYAIETPYDTLQRFAGLVSF